MALGGWVPLKKALWEWGKKKRGCETYVRPIKAVGWVYLIVSREYIDCQKKQLWQVATLPGLDHGINRGGDQENDRKQTEGIEINARKHRNNRKI